MLKTYRIIPLVFILFLFGFTLITASPVFAQTVDQLIERIEALDANDRAKVLEYKYSPKNRPSDATTHAKVTDGPWNPSMGMRHPDRPCMNRAKHPGGCGPDRRSPEQKASDPYDTNNPASQAARANPAVTEPHAKVTDGPWNPSMGMCHNSRPCMKAMSCGMVCNPQVRESKGYVDPNDTKPAAVADGPTPKPSDATHEAVADGPWDPSMGMRHPARPCMKNGLINPSKGCGPDNRASAIIARDPYDKEYIILKRAAPALEQACFRRCDVNGADGWARSTCKGRCVAKRPNPRCKGGSFSGFYTTESSLRCLN